MIEVSIFFKHIEYFELKFVHLILKKGSNLTMEPQYNIGQNCIAMSSGDGYYLHNQGCYEDDFSPLCQIDPYLDGEDLNQL